MARGSFSLNFNGMIFVHSVRMFSHSKIQTSRQAEYKFSKTGSKILTCGSLGLSVSGTTDFYTP